MKIYENYEFNNKIMVSDARKDHSCKLPTMSSEIQG